MDSHNEYKEPHFSMYAERWDFVVSWQGFLIGSFKCNDIGIMASKHTKLVDWFSCDSLNISVVAIDDLPQNIPKHICSSVHSAP